MFIDKHNCFNALHFIDGCHYLGICGGFFVAVVAKIWTHIVKFRVFSVTTTLPKLEKLLEQQDAKDKSTPLVLWFNWGRVKWNRLITLKINRTYRHLFNLQTCWILVNIAKVNKISTQHLHLKWLPSAGLSISSSIFYPSSDHVNWIWDLTQQT